MYRFDYGYTIIGGDEGAGRKQEGNLANFMAMVALAKGLIIAK